VQQILVVTSGCTDGTTKIVQSAQATDNRIVHINEDNRCGKNSAMNLIIRGAKGSDVVVFLSADVAPSPNSIQRLLSWFSDPAVGAVNATVVANSKTGFSLVPSIMWKLHNFFHTTMSKTRNLSHLTGEMCAVRSFLLQPVPKSIINDDAFLAHGVRLKGYGIEIDPNAEVLITAPMNIFDLLKQRTRVNIGHLQMLTAESTATTVTPSLFKAPGKTLPPLMKFFINLSAKEKVWSVMLVACELISLTAAYKAFSRHKIPVVWSVIASTKTVQHTTG
jgi:cellulose synthase/poly-beta-1,6-N-acetylglucosamine synthase-like glycosyltransferase